MTPVHKNSAPCPQLFTHTGTMDSPSWHAFCRASHTCTHLRKCEPCLKIIEKSFLTLPPISVQYSVERFMSNGDTMPRRVACEVIDPEEDDCGGVPDKRIFLKVTGARF